VQMAVLSFQQQTALQVSTLFTQAVKNNSNNDDDDDNINNSNSRSCDSNIDTNNNINSHSDSNSNNSNDDDKLQGQLVRETGVWLACLIITITLITIDIVNAIRMMVMINVASHTPVLMTGWLCMHLAT